MYPYWARRPSRPCAIRDLVTWRICGLSASDKETEFLEAGADTEELFLFADARPPQSSMEACQLPQNQHDGRHTRVVYDDKRVT